MAFVNRGLGTPLVKCPHMTTRCPHYKAECKEAESSDCHYIKRTTSAMITAWASLRAFGAERLPLGIKGYLAQTEAFLRDEKIIGNIERD